MPETSKSNLLRCMEEGYPFMHRRQMSVVVLMVAAWMGSTGVLADTLEQAAIIALAENQTLRLERERLEVVKTETYAARAMWLPSLSANIRDGRKKNISDATINEDTSDDKLKELLLELPLFTGFRGVNKYKEVDAQIRSAQAELVLKEQQVLFSVVETYANNLKSVQLLSLREQLLEVAQEKLQLVEQRRVLKLVDENEQLRYRADVLKAQTEIAKQQRAYHEAKMHYTQIVGVPPKALQPFVAHDVLQEFVTAEANTVKNNPDIRAKYWKWQAAKYVLKGEKGKVLPTVDFSASINKQQDVVYLDNNDLETRSWFINVKIPLFQKGMEYYWIRKASHEMNVEEADYHLTREQVLIDLEKRWEAYQWALIYNRKQQGLLRIVEQRRKKIGQQLQLRDADRLEWLSAEEQWLAARIEVLSSHYDVLIGYYGLQQVQGKLFSHLVEWDGGEEVL